MLILNKLGVPFAFLFLSHVVLAGDNEKINAHSCAQIDNKIAKVKTAMENRYSEKRGQSLRAKLKGLQKQKTYCKRKNFSTS